MSAILGVFHLNGQPAAADTLDNMMQPMAYWGPDGSGVWHNGSVGLGQLMLYNTPESLHEELPLQSRCGKYVLVSSARLDNREELYRCFDISSEQQKITPDSQLILQTYKKWGEDCPHHLLGDWVFAVRDLRENKLFIARDHHGIGGVYYSRQPNFFAFSSGIKGLLALPEIPRRLNEMQLAQLLVVWPRHGRQTMYSGIHRLPPAHCLTVTPGSFTMRRYWCLEQVPRLYLKSDQEYVEAFLEIYTEAVRCRLRSHRQVGVTLSGGLDSGSVAALAADMLRQRGQSLPAFCGKSLDESIPLSAKKQCYDFPYAQITAEHVENIELNAIEAADITPLEGIRRGLKIHDEPVHAAANQYWLIALWQEAQRQGIGSLLTGTGGNATISWHGAGYFAQLARRMRWYTLAMELSAWKKKHRTSLPVLLKQLVIKPLLPLPVQAWRQQGHGGSPWEDYSVIHPAWAERLGLAREMRKKGHDAGFGITSDTRQLRYNLIRPGRSMIGYRLQQTGAAFGLEVSDPTTDRRVMEFCLSIPDNQYVRSGEERLLIRRAMADILPDSVLWNQQRGLQAADVHRRIKSSSAELASVLDRLEKKAPLVSDYLDCQKMRQLLGNLEREKGLHARKISAILLRGVMAALFLCDFS